MDTALQRLLRQTEIRRALTEPKNWRLVFPGGGIQPLARSPRFEQAWSHLRVHRHGYLEILAILAGSGRYAYQGAPYAFRPGTFFFFYPDQPHFVGYPETKAEFRHVWISIVHGELFTRMLTSRHGRIFVDQIQDCGISLADCGLAGKVLLPGSRLPAEVARLRLHAVLSALVGGLLSADLERSEEALSSRALLAEKIKAIRAHMRETGGRDADLEHLADLAGCSKFHFLRVFKEDVGCTVHAYVDQCRVHKAKDLRAVGMSKTGIAKRLGFGSSSAYSHWQRRVLDRRRASARDPDQD